MSKKIIAVILVLFSLIPLSFLIIKTFSGIWIYPDLLPKTGSLRSFRFLIKNNSSLLKTLLSSLFYSLASVFVSFCITVLPARVLARRNFTNKNLIEILLMVPLFIPGIIVSLGFYPLFSRIHLTDNYLGVILVLSFTSFPYMLKPLVTGFESYPSELNISAQMLGAGFFRRLRTVHLPQLFPAILAGSFVVFLASFSEYFLVYLIGGGVVESFSGFLIPYLKSSDWGIASALSLLFFIIPVVVYTVFEYFMIKFYKDRGIKPGVNL